MTFILKATNRTQISLCVLLKLSTNFVFTPQIVSNRTYIGQKATDRQTENNTAVIKASVISTLQLNDEPRVASDKLPPGAKFACVLLGLKFAVPILLYLYFQPACVELYV
jgi:hypothetical protein